ncbi:MAG: LamG domain-containing protein [Candidatus Cloacimonetes bacterium]|nr:LamG domain-containing protein [Candidatus Cloacimonadota bacterium]
MKQELLPIIFSTLLIFLLSCVTVPQNELELIIKLSDYSEEPTFSLSLENEYGISTNYDFHLTNEELFYKINGLSVQKYLISLQEDKDAFPIFRQQIAVEKLQENITLNADDFVDYFCINYLYGNTIAFFPFTGNTIDYSKVGNLAYPNGPVYTVDRFGRPNNALLFDGVNDYLFIPPVPAYSFDIINDSYSLSLWIKTDDSSNCRIIEQWNEHIYNPYPFLIQIHDSRLSAAVYDTNEIKVIVAKQVSDDNWHHLVFSVDSEEKEIRLWLDTEFIGVRKVGQFCLTQNNLPIYLGGYPIVDRFFKGAIDDLMMFDKALTEREIYDLYNSSNN